MPIVDLDLGEVFAGRKTGNMIRGWDVPQPYTPAVDDNYILPEYAQDILMAFRTNQNVWVFGPQGTGKSSAVRYIAAKLNWPVYEVTAHSRLEFPELCGAYHVQDGNMVWHDGPLVSALRGGGLLVVSEVSLLDPSTAAGLNAILDGMPLFVPETNEYVQRHPEFRFAVTDNSNGTGDATGLYQGVLRQNAAFTSRFMYSRAEYLSPKQEIAMMQRKVPSLPEEVITKMVEMANIIRRSYIGNTDENASDATDDFTYQIPITMSPRDLLRWGELTVAYSFLRNRGVDVVSYAFDRAFAFRADNATRMTLKELKQRVFPHNS